MAATLKYKSNAMESIHSTASALFSIGSIDKDQMLEYDRICLVTSVEVRSLKSKSKFHPTVAGAQNDDKNDLPK